MKTIDAVQAGKILIGKSGEGPATAWLNRANRHGMVAGATGTGKTVTLQVLAEAFSAAGVPVFAADIKGDLSGVANPCTLSEKLTARASAVDVQLDPHGAPVACRAPTLRAPPGPSRPPEGTTRAPKDDAIRAVASVEPSSTTRISRISPRAASAASGGRLRASTSSPL